MTNTNPDIRRAMLTFTYDMNVVDGWAEAFDMTVTEAEGMQRHIKFPPLLKKLTCFSPLGIVQANGLCELFKPCNLGIDPRRMFG